MNEQVPFIPTPETPAAQAPQVPSASAIAAQEAQEKARYRQVRAKALEDPNVLSLQDKADTAPNEDEQKAASKSYYKALFDKMREIEPSLKDRIDRTEAATLRRIK
jgi:hypothetical protein